MDNSEGDVQIDFRPANQELGKLGDHVSIPNILLPILEVWCNIKSRTVTANLISEESIIEYLRN